MDDASRNAGALVDDLQAVVASARLGVRLHVQHLGAVRDGIPGTGLHQGSDELLHVDDTGFREDGEVGRVLLYLLSVLHLLGSDAMSTDAPTITHTFTGASWSRFESPEDHASRLIPARKRTPRAISSSCTSTIKGIPLLFASWLNKFRSRE